MFANVRASLVEPFENHNLFLLDRKSTRLNSSHQIISYAVFCLKKKNTAELSLQLHRLDREIERRRSRNSQVRQLSRPPAPPAPSPLAHLHHCHVLSQRRSPWSL